MKALIRLMPVVLLAVLVACRATVPQVVTAEVEFRVGTNTVRIAQPKDTTIGRLEWGGLVLVDYQSTASASAIVAAEAEARARAQMVSESIGLARDVIAAGIASQTGIKLPPASPALTPVPVVGLTNTPGPRRE